MGKYGLFRVRVEYEYQSLEYEYEYEYQPLEYEYEYEYQSFEYKYEYEYRYIKAWKWGFECDWWGKYYCRFKIKHLLKTVD